MVRRAIGHPDAGTLPEINLTGQRMHLFFQRESIFRVRAGDRFCGIDAIARLHFFNAIADGFDDSRSV